MIYRTLHTYILRELLRIFLMTASALTTLLAFGGTFRPFTKQGIDVSQLLIIVLNLMPAMLAYAIPIAALFAAVLVYWRMSTDNELTACRAGGVSFTSIVMPAFVLGLLVASVDLVFVNYVVPRFLQSTERAVMRDLGSLIASQISRQGKFQYDPLPMVVSADSAELLASDQPNTSVVRLYGMAASSLDRGKPSKMVVAQQAEVTIRNLPEEDSAEISFTLTNATGFVPEKAFQRYTGSVDSLLMSTGRPFRVPSILKSKPKFLNVRELLTLDKDPYLFPPVTEVVDRIEMARNYQIIAQNMRKWWQEQSKKGPVSFEQVELGGRERAQIVLYADEAVIDEKKPPEESLTFTSRRPVGGVRVEQREKGRTLIYTCDSAELILSLDQFTNTGVSAALQLQGKVKVETREMNLTQSIDGSPTVGITLPPEVKALPEAARGANDEGKAKLVSLARESNEPNMQRLGLAAASNIQKLNQTIASELHSRGSFALSCLTLVLFGAALGILLRGKNPLAVFVVGFVPAVLLVLLITAGREVTEGKPEHVATGIFLIWAGNGVLLLLVAAVFSKLLRR